MKLQRAVLGELCTLIKGASPISKTPPGPYPLVTTGESHKTADSFQFDTEAVCIPLISSTGHGHASIKRVHYQRGKFALANLLAAAVAKDTSVLSARFLARYLMFTKDRLIVPLMTGAANMSISIDRLATVPIRFPPKAEQERIVEFLDEADELRKLRAQADRRIDQLLPAIFHKMFGDVDSNSKRWPVKRFDEVCDSRLGKMLDARKQTGTHARPYLRNLNVQWGYLNLETIHEMDFDESEREEYRLRPSDVLICEGGAGVGQTAIWRGELAECYFQKSLHRVRPNSKLSVPEYIAQLIWMLMKTDSILSSISSATIPHLTGAKLKRLTIPVPPLQLQKEFARRTTETRALIGAAATSRRRLDELFRSLEHSAFEGDLHSAVTGLTVQPSAAEAESRRAAIACYIVDKLNQRPTFGRTQLMKGLYLTETYAQLNLRGEYERQAAGPFDKAIYKIEDDARREGWFTLREARTLKGHSKISYAPKKEIRKQVEEAISALGGARSRLDYVLALFKTRTTQDVEILTTLYAAWNDLLIRGRKPTDNDIVSEVLENWHEEKRQIPESRWRKVIQWMRREAFIPAGFGRATVGTNSRTRVLNDAAP